MILLAISALCLNVFGAGKVIENKAKPLKGEWDFNLQKVWATDDAGEDVLVRVGMIRVDESGKIYVLEPMQSKFFVFAADGKFLYTFGKKGEGPGEFRMAFNFFLLGDQIIVPEMGKFHFFSTTGKYIKSINLGAMIFPMAFLDAGRFIYTGDGDRGKKRPDTLKIYDMQSKKSKVIAEIPREESLTATSGRMVLRVKDSSSTPGIVLGARDNYLYFGKSDKYHIKKTGLDGKEIFSFTLEGRKRKKISTAYKRKRFSNVIVNGRKMPKEMLDQMVKSMPDEATFFNRIKIDENGLIYVFISDLENETGREVDIFSARGKYLYHGEIEMPDNYVIKSRRLIFKSGYLYVFADDEEGEGKLLKFKIDMPKN